jgi:hypothetical protein
MEFLGLSVGVALGRFVNHEGGLFFWKTAFNQESFWDAV